MLYCTNINDKTRTFKATDSLYAGQGALSVSLEPSPRFPSGWKETVTYKSFSILQPPPHSRTPASEKLFLLLLLLSNAVAATAQVIPGWVLPKSLLGVGEARRC